MANLALLDLQNEVYAQTNLDGTNVNIQTNVTRWLNFVQQDICARWPWTFLDGRESLATIPDYTTGTVTVSKGALLVQGSGVVWPNSYADGTYFIQFSQANDWYNIASYGGSAAVTMATPCQSAGGSNLAYVIRKFFYSLSATADEVLDVRNWNTPVKLIQCDFRTIDLINPLVQSTNAPYAYMMFGTDASGNQVFMPYPFPGDARLFEFRTRKRPTDMVNAGDPPSIPNKYAHLLTFGANALAFAYKKDFQSASAWDAKFEARIADMKKEYRQAGDYQPILGSIDSISRSRWINFPENYPVIGT